MRTQGMSTARAAAGGLALLLLLTACGGSDTDFASDAGSAPMPGIAEEPAMDAGADRDDSGGGSAGEVAPDGSTADPQAGREVIRTAELVLEVADPAAAATRIDTIATEAGGYVAETDLSRDAQGVVRGTVVLRVPSGELLATVDALDELAVAVPVRRVEELDVTTEVVDLRARIANLTLYEEELQALLTDVRERTSRPDDLLQVFERIREVRYELDQAQARVDVLADRVSLSTVTVTLVPAPSSLPVADPTWQPGQTAREALQATASALTELADLVIRFTLTFLPLALLLILPLALVILVAVRRQRRRPKPEPAPPVPPATPVPGVAPAAEAPHEPEVGAERDDDGPSGAT